MPRRTKPVALGNSQTRVPTGVPLVNREGLSRFAADQHVPGPIAIALMTNRPELVKIGMQQQPGTAEFHAELTAYAEAVVQEIVAERGLLKEMYRAVQQAREQAQGTFATLRRVEDALSLAMRGATLPEVQDKLRHPQESSHAPV